MPRLPSETALVAHNIRLRKGDYDELNKLFPKLKAGPAIRKIISNFIDRNKLVSQPLEIDLSEIEDVLE